MPYTIGIIGAGQMGRGIAQLCLEAELNTILVDTDKSALDKAQAHIHVGLERARSHALLNKEPAGLLGYLQASPNIADLECCDVMIEAIVEDFNSKVALYQKLEEVLKPDALLCSNTSSFSIAELAQHYVGPFGGLHFMNPPTRIRFVEIIYGLLMDVSHQLTLQSLVERLGCAYILAPDTPGFVVNRLVFSLIGHALHFAKAQSIPFEVIDQALEKGANLPMGPFRLADLIGLDTCGAILNQLHTQTGEAQFALTTDLQERIKAHALGKKTGKGFFTY